MDKIGDCFAEPIFILDGEHHRCGNCKFYYDDYCVYFAEKAHTPKCIMWEGEKK